MDSSPLTPKTRNEAWKLVVDLDRAKRYYSALATRMTRLENAKNLGLIVCVVASLTVFVDLLPKVVAGAAVAVIGCLSIWSLIYDYSYKLAVVRMVSERCREMDTECRAFWLGIDRMTNEQALQEWRSLDDRTTYVTSKPESAGIKERSRLNRTVTRTTYQVIGDEMKYA